MLQIPENLFELSAEEIEATKTFYDNKVIKCLVAPYHSYLELEKVLPYSQTTFLFPERELSYAKTRMLITVLVKKPIQQEIRIVTSSMSIIGDMIGCNVRILNESGEIVPTTAKTLAANIHDIRFKLLENQEHQLSEKEKTISVNKIHELITRIESADKMEVSEKEYQQYLKDISNVGDEIIVYRLKEMFEKKAIVTKKRGKKD